MQVQKVKPGYKSVKSLFGKYEEIPEDWDINELSEMVCIPISYGVLVPDSDPNGIPMIRSGELDVLGGIERNIIKISKNLENKYKKTRLVGGELLITLVGYTGQVALVPNSCAGYNVSRALAVIRLKKIFDNQFYYYVLKSDSVQKKILNQSIGSAQPVINLEKIRKLKLISPVLKEQKKISNILNNVDELIKKSNETILQTKCLKQGLMQQLFTKGIGHKKFKDSILGKIPDNWEMTKLSEVTTINRGKFSHRPRGDPDYFGGKYPFIQTGDIEKSEGFIVKHSQTLNEKGMSVSKIFPAGIIVVTIVGANIGNTSITTYPVCFPDSIIGISSDKMDIGFLETFLQTKKDYFKNIAINSARENLNLKILNNLEIPYPKLSEQKQIFSIFKNIDERITNLKFRNHNLKILKKGLMQKLLTGQIRVKI